MRKKYISYCIVGILLLAGISTVDSISIKKTNVDSTQQTSSSFLCFSEELNDASALDIGQILTEDELKKVDFDFTIIQDLDISQSDISLHQRDYGKYFFDIKDCSMSGTPGEPILPMKSFSFKLPKNSEVVDVVAINSKYTEIKNRLVLATMPQPFRLGLFDEDVTDLSESDLSNAEIFTSQSYFPGDILRFQSGKTNDENIVIVQFYPIQYLPSQGKLVLVNSAEIQVLYNEISQETITNSEASDAENIIITSESLYEQALDLKNFHDSQGTLTQIVNTSWIKDNYEESDDPAYQGYSNPSLAEGSTIENYDYSLAKKMISFFNDSVNHPNLEYITLFGAGKIVPPSYYAYQPPDFDSLLYPISWNWYPTDLFYASPDLDTIPNYKLGRIPVKNDTDAEHIVDKIINWEADSEFFENTYFAGGLTINFPYMLHEALIVDLINNGYVDGSEVNTYFSTDDKFNPESMIDIFENKSGLVFHSGHGSGISLDAGFSGIDKQLFPEDMFALKQNLKSNIFISASCLNGAYDTELIDLTGNPEYPDTYSFGESVLMSDSAGICYIGSSRVSTIGAVFNFENGRLRLYDTMYFADMYESVFKSYQMDADSLGELTYNAIIEYQKSANMSDPLSNFTLFEFTLLGDPALKLPERPQVSQSYQIPNSTVNNPIGHIKVSENGSLPVFENKVPINITSKTDAPSVDVKIIDLYKEEDYVIQRSTLGVNGDEVDFEFSSEIANIHLIRIITPDSKEDWLYVLPARLVDDDFNSETPGYGETRWSVIQDAIDAFESFDSSRPEVFYVFNGTYKENLVMKKSLALMGEHKNSTIIDGQENGNVITLSNGDYEFSDLSIINSGKTGQDSAISMTMKNYSLVVINTNLDNNNNAIYAHSGISGLLLCQFSKITNNSCGIRIESSRFFTSSIGYQIVGNIIKDNNYGILIKKSGVMISENAQFVISGILFNEIENNRIGLLLLNSKWNIILVNNFIDNTIHSMFFRSSKNLYLLNYWDNWRGVQNPGFTKPKYIFGTRGRLGIRLRPAKDSYPLSTPFEISNPYEF